MEYKIKVPSTRTTTKILKTKFNIGDIVENSAFGETTIMKIEMIRITENGDVEYYTSYEWYEEKEISLVE